MGRREQRRDVRDARSRQDQRGRGTRYPLSTAEDVDRAVEAAHRALQEWRDVPAPERMEYVHGLIEIWRRHRDELAEAVTLEMGKPIREARSEVDRGIGEMRFTAGEALRVGGETLPSGRRAKESGRGSGMGAR